jgi:coenzyme PQQ precursor peptide PqqA
VVALPQTRMPRGSRGSYSDVIARVARGCTGALGPPFFVLSGGINDGVAELTRCAPHQRAQTRRRNDAMVWSTPEVREVCVGMEVTSYLSAEM